MESEEKLPIVSTSWLHQDQTPPQKRSFPRLIEKAFVPNGVICAVFDGNRESGVSEYLKNNLVFRYLEISQNHKNKGRPISEIWTEVFDSLDKSVCSYWNYFLRSMGSSATVMHFDAETKQLYLVSVGNSEGYAFSSGTKITKTNIVPGKKLKICTYEPLVTQSENYNDADRERLDALEDDGYITQNLTSGEIARICYLLGLKWSTTYEIDMYRCIGNKTLHIPGKKREEQPVISTPDIKTRNLSEENSIMWAILWADGCFNTPNLLCHVITNGNISRHFFNSETMNALSQNIQTYAKNNTTNKDNNKALVTVAFDPQTLTAKFCNQEYENTTKNEFGTYRRNRIIIWTVIPVVTLSSFLCLWIKGILPISVPQILSFY